MRVLIVNNGVNYPTKLAALFPDATIEVLPAFSVPDAYPLADHDCIVLSGSNHRPIPYHHDEIAPLLEWIPKQTKPLIGVCYGAELMAEAYGGTLHHVGPEGKFKGFYTTDVSPTSWDVPARLCIYEAHQWIIQSVVEPLQPVITSPRGVLMFHHADKPQVGVIFHLEKYRDGTDGYYMWQKIAQRYGLPLSF
jgi:GMP synthase-like glutamine amidotransferase